MRNYSWKDNKRGMKIEKKLLKEVGELALYIILGYLIAVGANKALDYTLDTDYPVVAVVTTSMIHKNPETYKDWFLERDYTEQEITEWPFNMGMRQGDIVVVKGLAFDDIKIGDVIVYKLDHKEPIIHRVVRIEEDGLYTKGDNNKYEDQFMQNIAPPIEDKYVQGKAIFHIPLFGWVKIIFLKVLALFNVGALA